MSGSAFQGRSRQPVGTAMPMPPSSACIKPWRERASVRSTSPFGMPLAAPVVYPGSVERTSWAEQNEEKKYAMLRIALSGPDRGKLLDAHFEALPARPMVDLVLDSATQHGAISDCLGRRLSALDPNAIVRVHYDGAWTRPAGAALSAASLRAIAPMTMNISLARTRF